MEYDQRYYESLPDEEVFGKIQELKARFGKKLIILAHHYQLDEVFQFADYTGDSLKLSQQSAENREAEFIVFCGVYFMAEVARMLAGPNQYVVLPDFEAGCFLADCASADMVNTVWSKLKNRFPNRKIVPVVYINSSAQIKAFCGKNGGIICTSGNAQKVLNWAFKEGDMVLFLPDQHLGRNISYKMGINLKDMFLLNSDDPIKSADDVSDNIKIILWPGYCDTHQEFTIEDISKIRREKPETKIIVHPECSFEVAKNADALGSTEQIIKTIESADENSSWAIGTEREMVKRLTNTWKGRKEIFNLSESEPYCQTMKKCTARRLLWVLDNLSKGDIVNEIHVPDDIKENSLIALKRMLEISK